MGLLAAGWLAPRDALAQARTAPKAKAPPGGSKAPATSSQSPAASKQPAAPQRTADEETARNDILQSRSWQDLIGQFDEWLSIQILYDEEQVRHIRSRLKTGIGRMSAEQLQRFEGDLREKIALLTSDRALDAQDYLAAKFLVASEAYTKKIRQQLPDLLTSSAAQIDQRLSMYVVKRESRAQAQQSFEQTRERRLASNAAELKARQQHRDRIASRRTEAVNAASTPNNFTPARDYFPAPTRPQIVIGGGFY
jgi:hypothetical protein